MKKVLISILVIALAFSMVSCGEKNVADESSSQIKSSLEILETVWDAMPEDSKFFSFGGNINTGTSVDNAPGDFGVSNAEDVDYTLGFPEDSIDMIDQAANLIHVMNANTLTMASYHITDKSNLDAAVKAIDDNLTNRQWMCGFPDKLAVITIDGEYVVSIFGSLDLVEGLKTQVTKSYSQAVVAVYKDLVE